MKYVPFALAVVLAFAAYAASARAEEVTLLYTGETHAMLYPCNCPVEPDGGVSRRASLVQEIRKKARHTLLVDSGAFSAGGVMDEYSQSAELDAGRTRITLKAMDVMKYDAAACGDEELFYGMDSLKSNVSGWNVPLVCANIKSDLFKPYVIREAGSLRFGIIAAITDTAQQKLSGLTVEDPVAAVSASVKELRERRVDVIVLLSHLGETVDLQLLQQVEDIDILVSGNGRHKEEPFTTVGRTLLLRPSWQGRRLGRADLVFENKKLINFKVEEVRLSDAVPASKAVGSFLPACFADRNCTAAGSGVCDRPGTMQAACSYSPPVKIGLTVITDQRCRTCDTETAIASFKKNFPGLQPSILEHGSAAAKPLLSLFEARTLPVYLFSRDIEKAADFGKYADRFEKKGDWYMLKVEHGGVGLFIDRPAVKGKFDLFLNVLDPNAPAILAVLEEFRPSVRFIETPDDPGATEEMLRCVCVKKHYPGLFWNYLSSRVQHIRSSWWEDALGAVDPAPVRACARSDEGRSLLLDNTELTRELGITAGPAYVLDNREIFSSRKIPRKEEFRTIINGK